MQQNNGGPPHQKHTSDGRRCSGSKYPEPTSGNQDLNLHATGSSSISHTIPCLLDLPMLRPPPYLPQYRRSQFQSVHPTAVLCLPDHPPGVSIGPPAFSVPPPRLPFFQTHQSSQLSGENVGAVQMYGSYRDGNIITPKDDVLTEASGCTSNSRGQNAKGQHIKGKSRGKGYRNHLQQWGDTSGGVAADGGILSEVLNGMPIEYNSSCDDDRSSIHSEASSSARGHTRGNRWNNQRGRGFNRGRGSRNVNIVGGEQQQQYDVIGSSGQSGGRGQRSGRRGPRGGRVNRGKRGANNQSIRPAAAFIGSSTVEANSDSTEFSSDREHGSGRGWEERDGDKVQNDGQPESEAGDVENSDYESSGNALAADEELAVGQTLTQSTKLSKIQRERSRQKWKKELVHERQQSDDSSNMCTDQGKGDSDANFFNMACFADSAGVAVDGTLQPTRMSEHDKTRLLQEKMSCGERQQVIPETDMKAREGACQSDSVASGSVRGQWSHERRSRGRGRVNRGSRGRNQVNRQYHDSFKEDNADHDDDDDTESRDQATMSSTDTAAKQAGNHAQKQRQKTLAEVDIIRILVREHRGKCSLDQIVCSLASDTPVEHVKKQIERFDRVKVFVNVSDVGSSIVFVLMKELKLCAQRPVCRLKDECKYLHMCPDLITFGACRNERQCQNSHDLKDTHNLEIVKGTGLLGICDDNSLLLDVVRCSNTMVCAAYNGLDDQTCTCPETCLKLHVCDNFLHDCCLLQSTECPLGHDLYEGRNKSLLQLYRLMHMKEKNEKFLFRMLYIYKGKATRPQEPVENRHRNRKAIPMPQSPMPQIFGHSVVGALSGKSNDVFANSTINASSGRVLSEKPQTCVVEKALCEERDETTHLVEAINEIPSAGITVRELHKALEAVHVSSARPEITSSLSNRSVNCDEYESHECSDSSQCRTRHNLSEPYYWRVKLHSTWWPLQENSEIERAFCNPDVVEYTTSFKEDEAPFQDVLEAKYLYDKSRTLSFETIDENSAAESTCKQYEIDFGIMKQLNLKTGYKRAICRRPEFHHTGNKTRVVNYHYDETKLPIGESWLPMNTKMEGWTDLIPITADHPQTRHQYSRVCAEFFKTLPKTNYKICKMYHIQNLDLWKKYTDKKKKISTAADVTEQFERYLFHGTPDEQTVRCICHQNFDPRMHGRHGTVYGKGAYFSTTSKYSNSYAKSFEGHQYMFFARVLVGKFAVGKSEYQRPPPLNERWPHGALFDTCVDRVDNPSIYVVFNNDQCYPEFLIDYQEVNRVQDVSRPHTSSSSGPYTQNVSNIRSTGAAGPTPAAYAPLYQGVPSGTSSFASASSTTNSPSPSNPVPPSKPQPKDKGCAVM